MERIKTKLPNGLYLVATVQDKPFDNEITISLEKKSGFVHQDLALVRLDEESKNKETMAYDVLVWTDHNQEEYTHKFRIDQYDDETENMSEIYDMLMNTEPLYEHYANGHILDAINNTMEWTNIQLDHDEITNLYDRLQEEFADDFLR